VVVTFGRGLLSRPRSKRLQRLQSETSAETLGRVAPGIAPWRSHRSGRAQLRHPVRLVMASLSRFAICERYVNPRPRYKALDGWPAHKSMTNLSLPSPGSPRSRFPCFNGTMKRCDSLRPFHRASLYFARRYQVLRLCFAPCGPERTTAGLGFVIRSPYRKIAPGDDQGLPSSWEAFVCLCHVLRPRQDRHTRP
jgi:hypothetical protein